MLQSFRVDLNYRGNALNAVISRDGGVKFCAQDIARALGRKPLKRQTFFNESETRRVARQSGASDLLSWLTFEALPWVPKAMRVVFGK